MLKILEALHSQTPPLIHRDIKPANLIIRRQDDLVFLVDFGLAREFHSQAGARTLVGTVGYCPLEQLQGQPEPRSDLYALGATLFELLTGQLPKPLNIPPVRSVQPDVPECLAQLVDQSVRPNLDERFPDALAMRQALEAVRTQMAPSPPRPKKKKTGSDRAEHLLTSWGRTMAEQPTMAENPWASRRRWQQVGAGLLLLSLVFGGVKYRGRQHYLSSQWDLVKDALSGGVPAPGWVLDEAVGLFPAKGLGLGEPNRDYDASVRSGAIFRSELHGTQVMHFRMQRLKGTPRLLVFCQPWGVILEPRSKNYELRVLRVPGAVSLDAAPWTDFKPCAPVNVGSFAKIDVRLSIAGRKGLLQINQVNKRKFTAPEAWRGKSTGVVLLNAVKGTRCVVEGFQLR